MKKQLLLNLTWLLLLTALVPSNIFAQGLTTANLSGRVLDSKGSPIQGAMVVATHAPSNSKYGARTNKDGIYNMIGLRVGGPYTLKASLLSLGEEIDENVYLKLGSNSANFRLEEKSNQLKEVVISAKNQQARGKTGSETVIGKDQIMSMPTLSRDLNDFTRLTAEANMSGGDNNGISIAGQNNRMNAIYIDGAISNDVFGLANSGTNGGQTGSSPFSIDAIESIQVQTSPFDVKNGGFAGGSISAVTRSGTNQVEGSVYMMYRNQDMAGRTPKVAESSRQNLSPFSSEIYGFRIGLPIKKDKIFLFSNIEYTKDNRPIPFTYSQYGGNSSQSQVENLANTLRSRYGYDPGDFMNAKQTITSWKFISKLDFNLNDKNKLSVRYSLNDARNTNANFGSSNATRLLFSSNYVNQPNITHSLAVDLHSIVADNVHNNLIIGYTNVKDDRGSSSNPFPQVTINDGSGNIVFGTEAFSSINLLKQSVYTLTDNLTFSKGKHNFTIGTHNEFYSIFNAFVGEGLGAYTFSNLNSFLSGGNSSQFRQSYSIIDREATDNTKAAADFNALQLGFYGQDEINVTDKLKVSVGLRFDIPFYLTSPLSNAQFNDSVIPRIEARGYDMSGARIGQMPGTSIHISPRLGFNYDVKGDGSILLRGGTGIFTSRIPFVWLGGLYSNSGNLIGFNGTNRPFNPDPASAIPTTGTVSNREVDLIEKDFKLPQFWKTSLGIDKKFPNKIRASVDLQFTKTLNNYSADNYAKYQTATATGAPGNRPFYGGTVDSRYGSNIIVIKNTGLGYAWNASFTIGRSSDKGLSYNLGYTFGESMVGMEPSSSQNRSNWRYMENVSGRNFLPQSYSDFDMGHRIFGFVGYRHEFFKNTGTTISLFFNGQSGRRFSWVAGTNTGTNDGPNGGTGVDLLYIPTDIADAAKINFVANGSYSAAQQRQDFMDYINQNEYLSSKKGSHVERNGDRLPFQFNVDMRLAQEFYVKYASNGRKKTSFEITFDIFNVTNLINNDWGVRYFLSDDAFRLLNVVSNTTANTTYNFINQKNADGTIKDFKTVDDTGIQSSRWQGQLGLRFNF